MDFDLNEEQRTIREMVRRFADEEIVPAARQNDIEERFPEDILKKMSPLGLLGGPIPKEYGGAGLDYISHAIIMEEIGRGCSSVRTTISVHVSLNQLAILSWGSEAQKRMYLPLLAKGEKIGCFALTEPEAGSDAANQKTTAVKKGDRWILNGHKIWISNGGRADVAIIFAQTDASKKHRGMAAFIVEKDFPGYSTLDMHGKLGLRSSNTGEIFLEDCEVPDENLLGEVGQGFKIAMSGLDNGRYCVAAGCVGIIQACLEASTSYAKERKQFGKPLAGFQLVQDMIARIRINLDAARLLVYRAGHVKNQGKRSTVETSIAKYFATESAQQAAMDAIQIHGGYGYSNEYPVERYLRDARVATLYEGTSQIQKLIIGRHETGIAAFV
jgi:butyryl-CoA dehydrogenase